MGRDGAVNVTSPSNIGEEELTPKKEICVMFAYVINKHFDLHLLDGTKIHASASWKKLKRVEYASTLLIERRKGNFSPTFAIA